MQPTNELYGALQSAYEHFNRSLFDGKLPAVIFTAQRQKGVMGYFSPERWVSKNGTTCHEIAINPTYVGKSALIEVFQTLVHEQCHLLQFCYGKPGRRGYHNKEWADMMESVGLMPSTTGRPGGQKTGEKMSDYPIAGGAFLKECNFLVSSGGFDLPWVDRFAQGAGVSVSESFVQSDLPKESMVKLMTSVVEFFDKEAFVLPEEMKENRKKVKYSCPGCGVNVWGKPELLIKCCECDIAFHET
ncbi:SprT-like domain-containing protein [Vibrio metschnikovii]|nr:SprT-like domain-containing protein [Vibrio metschnikovii]